MKTELDKNNRMKRDENYQLIDSIKTTIRQRIEAEYHSELEMLRDENEHFIRDEKAFYKEVTSLLKTVNYETKLKIVTQVGKGSTVLNEYVGNLAKTNYATDGIFDFISESRGNKPFSVGFSCLQSIEVIEDAR